jgi:hypothetical protein
MAPSFVVFAIGLLLAGISSQAHGVSPNPIGVLARDRAVSAATAVVNETAKITLDTIDYYRQIREAEAKKGAGGVTAAMANYQIKVADNGLDLQLFKGIFLFQKSLFMAGGLPGEVAAGLWSATMDRMVERQAAERDAAARVLLQNSVRNLNTNEFNALQTEGIKGKAAERFLKHIATSIDELSGADPEGRKAIADELLNLSFSMSTEQLRKLHDVGSQQKITKQMLKSHLP